MTIALRRGHSITADLDVPARLWLGFGVEVPSEPAADPQLRRLPAGDGGQPVFLPEPLPGCPVVVELVGIEVSPDGSQVRVTGDLLLDASAAGQRRRIGFYVADGAASLAHFAIGSRHQFGLSAIALSLWQPRTKPGRTKAPFMHAMVQQAGGRRDDVHAGLQVIDVATRAETLLGQSMVQITARFLDGVDLELPILAPAALLPRGWAPKSPDLLRARLWLLGEFLGPGPQALHPVQRAARFQASIVVEDDVAPPPLRDLFGDPDDPEFQEAWAFHVNDAAWPHDYDDTSPLIDLIEPLPAGEPELVARLALGLVTCGFRILWHFDPHTDCFVTNDVHPIALGRTRSLCMVRAIAVSADHVHAVIIADWLPGGLDGAHVPLAFYDSYWHLSRHFTRIGDVAQFALCLIAYWLAPAGSHRVAMATPGWMHDPAVQNVPGMADLARQDIITFELGQTQMLLPEGDARRDEFRFQGQVESSRKLPYGVLLEDAWEVLTEVLDVDDQPLVIKLLVTQRALAGGKPPRKGQFVTGVGWLQGHLVEMVARA
ncbi:MAG: hypothetical protein KGQ52_14855 [Alphaproteobacteria bacterium]|nr:hypothetical protein [Alphaproteobacteria bacterium]